ncbi:MAG: ATP-binding protein [Sulfuricurvum sp.]|uniref:ATP-binding protein n=1 Tax=Sulfuricurvum sp. TaxID=2025608 RepID=UPI0025DCE3E4|nr:ATP-binding protein [Sulfuricurvum sp.]MCK9374275.1 ATP-binding protein [Sulfuricurvum sp.]
MRRWGNSIFSTLLFWLLVLSFTPLMIIAVYNNVSTVESIKILKQRQLEDASHANVQLLKSWFTEAEIDLKSWSELKLSKDFFLQLSQQWKNSHLPLQHYVHSDPYQQFLAEHYIPLPGLKKRYGYVHDLLLIDTKGNILYSVMRESDLGSNLIDGSYSSTRFAEAFRATLHDKKIHFSDLERYRPSKDKLSGFLCEPIFDEKMQMIGVLALQLNFAKVFDHFKKFNLSHQGVSYYLVGSDGFLRTQIDSEDEVLRRSINTEQFRHWYKEHILLKKKYENMAETVLTYTGPNGNRVFGEHHALVIFGIPWVHISEADESVMMELPNRLNIIAGTLLAIGLLIVTLSAYFIARRITGPIRQLSNATEAYMQGNREIQVSITASNEIGDFGTVFNQMIEQQRENEKRLSSFAREAFLSNDESIILIVSPQNGILQINKHFYEIFPYHDLNDFLSRHSCISELFIQREGYLDVDNLPWHWHHEVLGKPKSLHHVIMADRAGKEHIFSVRIKPVTLEEERVLLISFSDITEVENERRKAIAAERIKSEFLANMSHEIRTPLNAIIGMSHLSLKLPLETKSRNYIEKIERSAKNLMGIINDILDFSKIESGKLEVEKIAFNLDDVLKNVSDVCMIKIQNKPVELTFRIDPSLPKRLLGDPTRLGQILTNLLNNAIKFTEKGEIKLTVHPLSGTTEAVTMLRFDIEDTGIGMSDEQMEKLFHPFTQADGTISRKFGGSGLGLVICKQLVELMGGKIGVTSRPNIGTLFWFTLGFATQNVEESNSQEENQGIERLSYQKAIETIRGSYLLLVEDNDLNQEVALNMLYEAGVRADVASNGNEAVEMVLNNDYDGVLMDYQMPIMDGLEATRRIRRNAHLKNLPIIAMTANVMQQDKDSCTEAGMDDFIAKPIDIASLFTTLARWIKSTQIPAPTQIPLPEPQLRLEDDDDLRRVEGLDIDSALEHAVSIQMLYKFIDRFKESHSPSLMQIKESLKNGDTETARIQAHNLKGLAGYIGAANIVMGAADVEKILKENQWDRLEDALAVLEDRLTKLAENLKEIRYNDPSKGSIVITDIGNNLETFSHLLEQNNTAARKMVESVTRHLREAGHTFEAKEIELHMKEYRFQEALKIVRSVLQKREIH